MNHISIISDLNTIKTILQCSDEEMAREIGVTRMTIDNWRNNEEQITDKHKEAIYSFAYRKGIRLNRIKEQLYRVDYDRLDNKILFHGTSNVINGEFTLDMSRERNDFGRGIYCGDSFEQAAMFVATKKQATVYIVNFDMAYNYRYRQYSVDLDWMLTIANCRGRLEYYRDHPRIAELDRNLKDCDFVIAPIADNRMFEIIDEFAEGLITDVQCRHALASTDFGYQYVFLNENALEGVSIMADCYLSEAEKNEYKKLREERNRIGIDKSLLARKDYRGEGLYIDQILK